MQINTLKKFLTDFFDLCDYPDEAKVSLLRDFDKLWENAECRAHFQKHIDAYEKDGSTDFNDARVRAGELAESVGVHPYAAELLMFCCFARHLRVLYKIKGISDGIWLDTVLDLRTKLMECRAMYGVWGSFVMFWFPQYFTLERFALGRLQYQLAPYYATKEPYTAGGATVYYSDSRALEVHIPSSGRLTEDAVLDSLRRAYKFFDKTEYMHDGILICQCSSWLLYPGLEETLPEDSNVVRFGRDFEITQSRDDPEFGDCWRVFNKNWDHDASALPRETTMQRCIADRLASGKNMGSAVGVLAFDGKNILTKRKGYEK